MIENVRTSMSTLCDPIETKRNHMKSLFSQFSYKTKNMPQNLKHDIYCTERPKGQNTTKSETWLKVSSKMIPKTSLHKKTKPAWRSFKILNHLPHKNALCQTSTC